MPDRKAISLVRGRRSGTRRTGDLIRAAARSETFAELLSRLFDVSSVKKKTSKGPLKAIRAAASGFTVSVKYSRQT